MAFSKINGFTMLWCALQFSVFIILSLFV